MMFVKVTTCNMLKHPWLLDTNFCVIFFIRSTLQKKLTINSFCVCVCVADEVK